MNARQSYEDSAKEYFVATGQKAPMPPTPFALRAMEDYVRNKSPWVPIAEYLLVANYGDRVDIWHVDMAQRFTYTVFDAEDLEFLVDEVGALPVDAISHVMYIPKPPVP